MAPKPATKIITKFEPVYVHLSKFWELILPNSHFLQIDVEDAPVTVLNLPWSHGLHDMDDAAPVCELHLPALQGMQSVAFEAAAMEL